MNDDRVPLFCDSALARRLERVEAELIAEASKSAHRRRADTAGFVIQIAGGVASFAEQGSPFNKLAGLGFGGVPTAEALDEIERAYALCGAPVQIELAHLADPEVGALLTQRGYRLASFENVLGLELDGQPDRVSLPGIEVRPSGDDEFEAWIDVVADGFAHPDPQGVPSHEEFPRDVLEWAERDFAAAGVLRYIALRDGVVAGAGSLRVADGVAQLAGAATPAHRRRGVQSALLSARLADAASAGCDVAVVTTQPGSKSQQNVQRRGFDLLYTRAVLVKQPESRRGPCSVLAREDGKRLMTMGSPAPSLPSGQTTKEATEGPKVSGDSAEFEDVGILVDRHRDLDGYAVDCLTFRQDIDRAPLMKGLPDDRCQCPHWGYVAKRRLMYRFADREEVVDAGDAFYLPPGHIPAQNEPGSEIVQLSPTKELLDTPTLLRRNAQVMQTS